MEGSINIVQAKLDKLSRPIGKSKTQLLNIRYNNEVSSPFLRQKTTIQDPGLKLQFGKKMAKASPGQYLNPRLFGLLQFLYQQGPLIHGWDFTKLTSEEISDKKELKTLLIEGGLFCIADYSVRTILFVIRSFLKHMSEPLLAKELYYIWIEIGDMLYIESHFPKAVKIQFMLHDLSILMENASYYTDLFLRHFLVALHSLSCRNRPSPELSAIQQLAELFAPFIVYKRFEWAKGRNNYKKLLKSKQALVSFMIFHVHQIFGPGAQNLFPLISLRCDKAFCLCSADNICSADIMPSLDQNQDVKKFSSDSKTF